MSTRNPVGGLPNRGLTVDAQGEVVIGGSTNDASHQLDVYGQTRIRDIRIANNPTHVLVSSSNTADGVVQRLAITDLAGKDGKDGINGTNGTDGATGPAGPQGPQGVAGVGVDLKDGIYTGSGSLIGNTNVSMNGNKINFNGGYFNLNNSLIPHATTFKLKPNASDYFSAIIESSPAGANTLFCDGVNNDLTSNGVQIGVKKGANLLNSLNSFSNVNSATWSPFLLATTGVRIGALNPGWDSAIPSAMLDVYGDLKISTIPVADNPTHVLVPNATGLVEKVLIGSVGTDNQDLSVLPGGVNSSEIKLQNDASPVTIQGGSNVTITESGSIITIDAADGNGIYSGSGSLIGNTNVSMNGNKINFNGGYFNLNNSLIPHATTFKLKPNASDYFSAIIESSPAGANTLFCDGVNNDLTSNGVQIGVKKGANLLNSLNSFSNVNSATWSPFLLATTGVRIGALNPGWDSAIPSAMLDVYGDAIISGSLSVSGVNVPSDVRLKKNIQNLEYGLSSVMKLNTKQYVYKSDTLNKVRLGLIAQDLQKVIPELVITDNTKDKMLSVNYTELIPVLINAIQEQQAIIEAQKKQLAQKADSSDINNLKAELAELNNLFGVTGSITK